MYEVSDVLLRSSFLEHDAARLCLFVASTDSKPNV